MPDLSSVRSLQYRETKLIAISVISTREVFSPGFDLSSGLKLAHSKRTPKTGKGIATLVPLAAWVQLSSQQKQLSMGSIYIGHTGDF